MTTIRTTYKGQPLDVDVSTVTHFSAGDKYVTAHCAGRDILISRSLDSLELEYSAQFVRTHRAWLVRKCLVAKVKRGVDREYYARLHDGCEIPASRRRVKQIALELQGIA